MEAFRQTLADLTILEIVVSALIAIGGWIVKGIEVKYRILTSVIVLIIIIGLLWNHSVMSPNGNHPDNPDGSAAPTQISQYTDSGDWYNPATTSSNNTTSSSEDSFIFHFEKKYGYMSAADKAAFTEIQLIQCKIKDLSGIEEFVNLQKLDLSNNNLKDTSRLSGLTKLRELKLSDNDIFDISALSNLTNLYHLSIGGNDITDISALYKLSNLNELFIRGNPIQDISVISYMPNLKRLTAYGCNIKSIAPVSNCPYLNHLSIYDNEITDISPLYGLRYLQVIKISGMNIPEYQIEQLRSIFPNAKIYS